MSTPENSNDLLRQAAELIISNQKRDAYQIINRVLKVHPDDAQAWWLLAHSIDDKQLISVALQKVVQLRPDFAAASEWLAKIKEEEVQSVSRSSTFRTQVSDSTCREVVGNMFYGIFLILIVVEAVKWLWTFVPNGNLIGIILLAFSGGEYNEMVLAIVQQPWAFLASGISVSILLGLVSGIMFAADEEKLGWAIAIVSMVSGVIVGSLIGMYFFASQIGVIAGFGFGAWLSRKLFNVFTGIGEGLANGVEPLDWSDGTSLYGFYLGKKLGAKLHSILGFKGNQGRVAGIYFGLNIGFLLAIIVSIFPNNQLVGVILLLIFAIRTVLFVRASLSVASAILKRAAN